MRLQGSVGLDVRCYTSEINPNVRFFVFDQPPDMDELLPVTGPTPAALPPPLRTEEELWTGCSGMHSGRSLGEGEEDCGGCDRRSTTSRNAMCGGSGRFVVVSGDVAGVSVGDLVRTDFESGSRRVK